MDLSTLLSNIDAHKYVTVKDFLHDVDLIWKNALEYNPDRDPSGKSSVYLFKVYFCLFYFTLSQFRHFDGIFCSIPTLNVCLIWKRDCASLLSDRLIRHRACALKDTVHAIIKDQLDEDFEKICQEIKESRSKRGSIILRFILSLRRWDV